MTLQAIPSSSTKTASPRILLVDDEDGILQMLAMTLSRQGYVTEQMSSAPRALARLGEASFDVIVSDINMPGVDGLEFLRRVRERDLDVPVVMMTGRPSLESSNQALEYGAFQYLMKPVAPAALKTTLARAIRLHDLAKLKRRALELYGDHEKWLGDRAALESHFNAAAPAVALAFQPIVSLGRRETYAYEALLRSNDPVLSNPGLLLDAAERLGRVHELSRSIRARAAAANPPPGVKLFVNLHPLDLADDELVDASSPLSRVADRVVLEITERASLDAIDDVEARIAKLRQLGFMIAIDDLGAGYAGLTSFTRLQPDVAKLDMGLIRGIDVEPTKQSIVRSMGRLCGELGILLVAEGVETVRERDTLRDLGCDIQQGYLFGKPAAVFTDAFGSVNGRRP